MFLKVKISCQCHCQYFLNENADVGKIVCPNCSIEHPHSAKLLQMLKCAKEITVGSIFDNEVCTTVISEVEELNGLR